MIIELTFCEHLLCIRLCSMLFAYANLFDPPNDSLKWALELPRSHL